MMRSVFTRTLYDKRFFIIGWFVGMAILGVIMVSFFPAMRQDNSLDALVEGMPSAFQGLVGDLENLRRFDLFLASQMFDIRASMFAAIMAIIIGVSLSTKDEESGELRTILSLPISRVRLAVERWVALVFIAAITVLGMVVGSYATMPFIDDASIGFDVMMKLAGMTSLVLIACATLTYAIGVAAGKKALAMVVGTLVVVGSYLISIFSVSVEWLRDVEMLSVLHYFDPVSIVKDGVSVADSMVLVAVTIISLVVAIMIFRRRDIA